MTDEQALGPISYLIVEFPGSKMTGEGLPVLVDLVDRGLIRILDLTFVTRADDGSIAASGGNRPRCRRRGRHRGVRRRVVGNARRQRPRRRRDRDQSRLFGRRS